MNGKKLCIAGVGDRGVLSAIISWVAGDRDEDLFLHVGGLVNEEHIDWIDHTRLQIGDEIRVQICDVESGDDPWRKRRRDAPETLDGKSSTSAGSRRNLAGVFRLIQTILMIHQHDNC